MVELPDDAIDALCKTVGHALATHPRITGSALTALANADGQTAVELRERVLTVIAGAAFPLIAARVRAEAVADERQRIKGALERLIASETPGLFSWTAWRVTALREALQIVAAGSVPVATPQPGPIRQHSAECGGPAVCSNLRCRCACHFEGMPPRYDQCDGTCTVDCGHCKGQGRPVATPTKPADPTYGRIDADIQQAVDAMEPESIGSRVAMENTLQARRDAASPVPAVQPEER